MGVHPATGGRCIKVGNRGEELFHFPAYPSQSPKLRRPTRGRTESPSASGDGSGASRLARAGASVVPAGVDGSVG